MGHEHGAPAQDQHAGQVAAAHGDPVHMARMTALRDQLRVKLGAAYEAPVPGLEEASPERGAETFGRLCSPCHGPKGKGDGPAGPGLQPPPADLTDPEHARFYTDAGRVEIIREGSPGTAMAAFGGHLSEAELLDVYAYVRTLRGDRPPPPDEGHHGH
ncbi:MAG: c-type cytochrome [Myxococcota bacterium]